MKTARMQEFGREQQRPHVLKIFLLYHLNLKIGRLVMAERTVFKLRTKLSTLLFPKFHSKERTLMVMMISITMYLLK